MDDWTSREDYQIHHDQIHYDPIHYYEIHYETFQHVKFTMWNDYAHRVIWMTRNLEKITTIHDD